MVSQLILLKISDRIAPTWQEHFELPGSTCTCFFHLTTHIPLAIMVDKIIGAIPGLRDIDWSPESIGRSRIAFLSEPVFQGLISGAFLGVIARMDFKGVLTIAMGVATTMVLLPRVATMLMEGLKPIADGAQQFAKRHLQGRDIVIGIDIAAGLGDPTVVTTLSLMVPISIGLALVLPGNRYFPTLWFAGAIYGLVVISMVHKGNLFRALVTETVRTIISIYVINWTAPLATIFMQNAGVLPALPEGAYAICSILANTIPFLAAVGLKLFGAW